MTFNGEHRPAQAAESSSAHAQGGPGFEQDSRVPDTRELVHVSYDLGVYLRWKPSAARFKRVARSSGQVPRPV